MKHVCAKSLKYLRTGLTSLVIAQLGLGGTLAVPAQAAPAPNTAQTPIKHVIVIVGENRSFDHVFATYKPKHGQSVDNLLSRGIIREDGTPGPKYGLAQQYSADATNSSLFQLSPKNKTLYSPLPAPLNGGPTDVCTSNGICSVADAMASEDGLPTDYYTFLTTGGTGLSGKVPDSRITGVFSSAPYSTLLPGPFQITNTKTSDTITYDDYAASPVHRFYQMWQQEDCDASYATADNPSGCRADLFPWVEVTIGAGDNGTAQPSNFSTDYAPGAKTTGEGSTSMGFYNVLQGDMPYFKELADKYSMSDNYHQPAMGGTGLDSIILGFGDALYFENADGEAAKPPHNQLVWADQPADAGVVDEIENPNPQQGTNNWWVEDGYGGGGFGSPVYGGGSYTECSDAKQPGVDQIEDYLKSLNPSIKPNCEPGHYYLLNNYNPGYFGDGSNAYTDHFIYNTPFTIPPTNQRSIANVLIDHGVSWKSYNDQWTPYLSDKYQLNYGTVGANSDQYCNICNPFQYQTSIMENPANRANIVDTTELYTDIHNGTLPAVSFVKPSGWVDGHPASSKFDLYEGFVKKIVDAVRANPTLWDSTAILITVDEGGGYYDSGYVQPLDFFGDGTRIPMIVVSKYSEGGKVSHNYSDHVSVLKFIEKNWNLPTITKRSRDNFPNPIVGSNPYVPTNSPALGDLTDLFHFGEE
jgi:phospholipase C